MKHNMNAGMRFFLFVVGSIILLGMKLTGFEQVHWLLYVPVVLFYFAALTGFCPGLAFANMIFAEAPKGKASGTKAPARKRKKR